MLPSQPPPAGDPDLPDRQARIRHYKEDQLRLNQLWNPENYEQACELAASLLQRAREIYGASSREVTISAGNLSLLCSLLHRFEEGAFHANFALETMDDMKDDAILTRAWLWAAKAANIEYTRPNEAIQLLKRAISQLEDLPGRGEDPGLLNFLWTHAGKALWRAGRRQEAARYFEIGLADESKKNPLKGSVEKAKVLLGLEDYAEAERLLLGHLPADCRQYVQEHPELTEPVAEINELLGVSACHQGDLERAERYALAACVLRVNAPASYARSIALLGEVYRRSGKGRLAKGLAEAALAGDPNLALAWQILGLSAFPSARDPEKIVCLAKALIASPVQTWEAERQVTAAFHQCVELLVWLGEVESAERLQAEFAGSPGRPEQSPPARGGT